MFQFFAYLYTAKINPTINRHKSPVAVCAVNILILMTQPKTIPVTHGTKFHGRPESASK
jgi:hypothetical protein